MITPKRGSTIIIIGPMFSGKTEELLRRIRRIFHAKLKVQVFKPIIDKRYAEGKIQSHNGDSFEAQPVSSALALEELVDPNIDVVVIDEVQFFDPEIVAVTERLASRGIEVIVSGLAGDFRGLPFGSVPELIAMADQVIHLTAICHVCGAEATRTQRLVNGQPAPFNASTIYVGGAEAYEARCREHHIVPKPE